jgi:hypothetical protein
MGSIAADSASRNDE